MSRVGRAVLGFAVLAMTLFIAKMQLVYGVGLPTEGLEFPDNVIVWGILALVYVIAPLVGVALIHQAFNPPDKKRK